MNWYPEIDESQAGNAPIVMYPTPGLAEFAVLSPIILGIVKSHEGNFTQGQSGATYSVVVTNVGPSPTDGSLVTVTEIVPAGLTFVSMSGTGWTVVGNVATRSDVLASGDSYPTLTVTVNVDADAGSPLNNEVTITGGGTALVVTAVDSTTIEPSACVASPSQAVETGSGGGPTVSAVLTSPVAKNDLLICYAQCNSAFADVPTDDSGNTWVLVAQVMVGGNGQSIFTAKAGADAATLTVSVGMPTGGSIIAMDFTGPATQNGTGEASATFDSGAGPITLTGSGSVFIYALALSPPGIAGFTQLPGSGLYYADAFAAGSLTVPFGGPTSPWIMWSESC